MDSYVKSRDLENRTKEDELAECTDSTKGAYYMSALQCYDAITSEFTNI